jgi:hypothetical protein
MIGEKRTLWVKCLWYSMLKRGSVFEWRKISMSGSVPAAKPARAIEGTEEPRGETARATAIPRVAWVRGSMFDGVMRSC